MMKLNVLILNTRMEEENMSENKIAESYKGFDLISVTEIPDCSSTGVYLRHRKTGYLRLYAEPAGGGGSLPAVRA